MSPQTALICTRFEQSCAPLGKSDQNECGIYLPVSSFRGILNASVSTYGHSSRSKLVRHIRPDLALALEDDAAGSSAAQPPTLPRARDRELEGMPCLACVKLRGRPRSCTWKSPLPSRAWVLEAALAGPASPVRMPRHVHVQCQTGKSAAVHIEISGRGDLYIFRIGNWGHLGGWETSEGGKTMTSTEKNGMALSSAVPPWDFHCHGKAAK